MKHNVMGIYTHTHTHTHTYIYIYTHTHTHTYTYIHMYTYTYTTKLPKKPEEFSDLLVSYPYACKETKFCIQIL